MTARTLSKEDLAADFRSVMADIDALMNTTTAMADGEAAALRDRIRQGLDRARASVVDAQHEALEKARRAADATNHYVHDHPWQAVGAAAAVGLALGVLIGRR